MKDWRKAEDVAAYRVQLLSPLLEEGLDSAQLRKRKAEICAQTGLSERTLRRYLATFRGQGFEGLKPGAKSSRRAQVISDEVLEEATGLRSHSATHRPTV